MKKFFLTVASLALLGSGKALAISGGPFDNGDAGGILLERGSFYQCQFSFRNGNGYGIFTPDAQLLGGLLGGAGGVAGGGGGGAGQAAFYTQSSLYTNNSFDIQRNANRSVFYFKGVTYIGGCYGAADLEARMITGSCNATSDAGFQTQQQTAGAGGTTSLNVGSVLVQNNTGFILNAGFEAKIFQERPTLRFRGRGEVTVLSPTGNSAITNLAYTAYTGLIGAITASVGNSGGQLGFNPATYTEAQQAIADVLDGLRGEVETGGGTDRTYADSDVTPMRVSGVRRYF